LVYTETVKDFGRPIHIVETTNRSIVDARGSGSKTYWECTKTNIGKASIGPNGGIVNYARQGLPFSDVTPGDPKAGIKAAWSHIPPAKPEAWKTVNRSKRLKTVSHLRWQLFKYSQLIEPSIFLFLFLNVFLDSFLILTDCRHKATSSPKVLPSKIPRLPLESPGNVNSALALHETNHLGHCIFWGNRD
jgi:hypothetical protein